MLRRNPHTGQLTELSQKQVEMLVAYQHDRIRRTMPTPLEAHRPPPVVTTPRRTLRGDLPMIDEEPASPNKANGNRPSQDWG